MRIEQRAHLAVPPAEVWKLCGDPAHLAGLSDRLTIEPEKPGAPAGRGSRYRVLLKVGAVPVGGDIEVVVHDENRDLVWTTLTGVDHRMRVRLRERPDGGTTLTVRFAYDTPGVFGVVVDLVSFPVVRGIMGDLVDGIAAKLR